MEDYIVEEINCGVKILKAVDPSDTKSYHWAVYEEESGETMVFNGTSLEEIQWFDELADVIEYLKKLNDNTEKGGF